MKTFLPILSLGTALLLIASCTPAPKKTVAFEGCWLDETGVQALEVVKLDSNRVRIQSVQGQVEGILSEDTISAPTPPPLRETIRMIFRNDTALYEFLGTQQRFYRVAEARIAETCGMIAEASAQAESAIEAVAAEAATTTTTQTAQVDSIATPAQ